MKIVVTNGSPKGKASNTNVLASALITVKAAIFRKAPDIS